jgi:hypothetical protein
VSEALPVAMLELFRGTLKVHAGDFDNWEGWSVSQGSIVNDGDLLKLIIGSGYVGASIVKYYPAFSAGTYKYANIRVTELTGSQIQLFIRRADTQQWLTVGSWNTPGIIENVDLSQVYSGNIDGVGLAVLGNPGQYAVFDYLTVSDKKRRDPVAEGNCIDIKVHLGLLDEVNDFTATLWNSDYFTNLPLHVGMHTKIYGAREGGPLLKLFCGRVETLKALDKGARGNTVVLNGRCYGEELFRRTVNRTFFNMKGEDIVKYVIENYTSLKHVRGSTELVEATDTTYTELNFENTSVFDVLKHIANTADKSGVIGFDFRITYDGKFEFFQRGSRTSPCSIQDLIEEAEYSVDIHRIRNKIIVRGADLACLPRNQDRWTEPGSDPPPYWEAVTPNTYVSRISSNPTPVKGSYAVKIWGDGTGTQYAEARRTLTDENSAPTTVSLDSNKKLRFYVYVPHAMALKLRLYTDDNNYFRTADNYDSGGSAQGWFSREIPLGKDAEQTNDNPNGYWVKVGYPDWKNISKIGFWTVWTTGDTRMLVIDWLYFDKMPFEAIAQNTSSQSAYGLRELVVKDDELYSDSECSRRASALLDYYRNPVETIVAKSSVLDPANNRFLPGDKITVSLPKENISNAVYRIESVEHYFNGKDNEWITTLTLGKMQPLLADYLYSLRVKTDVLAKLKLAKR